jgi:hypothetical protein
MSFLQEDEIARGVLKALRSEEGQKILETVMARKLEFTFGLDCQDPTQRAETRKDMEFVRERRAEWPTTRANLGFISTLRHRTEVGVERVIMWALGVGGVVFLAWIGVNKDWLK